MSKLAPNGADVSVAIVVQSPAPAGLRWNSTSVVSASEVPWRLTVPLATAPGSANVGAGAWLSTVKLRAGVVNVFPARSVMTASTVAGPSEAVVESHVARYGAEVSVATVVPFTRRSTDATRDVASLAAAETVTSPETVAPAAGAPITPRGGVLSTIFDGSVVVVTFAGRALSVTTKRRSYAPSFTDVVSQSVRYGAVVSVAIVVQSLPLPPPWSACEDWKATEATPARADAVALSVTVPRRYAPGSVGRVPGGLASTRTSVEWTASMFPATSVEK